MAQVMTQREREDRAEAYHAALGAAAQAACEAVLRRQAAADVHAPIVRPGWYNPSVAIVWPGNAGSSFGRHLQACGWTKSYGKPGLMFRARKAAPSLSLEYGTTFADVLNERLPSLGVEKRAYALLLDY